MNKKSRKWKRPFTQAPVNTFISVRGALRKWRTAIFDSETDGPVLFVGGTDGRFGPLYGEASHPPAPDALLAVKGGTLNPLGKKDDGSLLFAKLKPASVPYLTIGVPDETFHYARPSMGKSRAVEFFLRQYVEKHPEKAEEMRRRIITIDPTPAFFLFDRPKAEDLTARKHIDAVLSEAGGELVPVWLRPRVFETDLNIADMYPATDTVPEDVADKINQGDDKSDE